MNLILLSKYFLLNQIKYFVICFFLFNGLNSDSSLGQQPTDDVNNFQVGFSANVFRGVYENDATAAAKVLTEFLLKHYNRDYYEVEPPAIFNDTDELRNIIKKQDFEVLIMHPSEFIQVKDLELLEPIAVSWRSGSPFDSYYLLVHKDSKLQGLKDLKAQSILICSLEGNKAELWLDHLLKQKKLGSKERFFSSIEFLDKPLSIILPVFFKKASACIVDESLYNTVSELNPQIRSELISLEISRPLAIGMVTIRKNISDLKLKDQITEAFLTLHNYEEARQYLTVFRIGKVIEYKEEYLNSTYEIMGLTK
ncbi:MAG: phosphate/phosphite/phosphonate ABC transporter substrate-binding protein [Ignavibacteria bacterium]|nr:phosphate/phosphite/phosphonate ABC transporter substrate-binding protein [Ignavibacteria bacterium]